jgi:hypothetical protein
MKGELSIDINMDFIYLHFFYIKLSTRMTGLTSLLIDSACFLFEFHYLEALEYFKE